MKHLKRTSALAVIGTAALGLGLFAAPSSANSHHHHQHEHQHHGETLEAVAPTTSESLYQAGIQWVNQHNQHLELSQLRGKPVIVSMIYANCSSACPVLVQDIKHISEQLDQQAQDIQVLVVSFDHENDHPQRLYEFAHNQRANHDNWHFVTGSAEDIRTWAALLGIRYRSNPNGGYDHSNVIAVLNREGELVYRHEGLAQKHSQAAQAVASTL